MVIGYLGKASSPADSALTVTAVSEERAFAALEPEWNALHEESGQSAFQSFAWSRTWWRHYGEDDPARLLYVLVVRDRSGALRAVAPFFAERLRAAALVPVTRLAFLGSPRSDYLDLLVAGETAHAALAALASHLVRHRRTFDVLVLDDVPERSPHLDVWLDALSTAGLPWSRAACDWCPRVEFASSWAETVAALPPATRGKMGRRIRQLEQQHGAELELAGGAGRLDADVEDLIALHQQRWTSAGQPGVFAEPDFAAFYREACRELADRGAYRLYFLRIGGRRVAGVSGFRHRDEFHFYHAGLGDAGPAARLSPGIALHLLAMESAFGEGVRTYDFLRGTEQYKADLGGVPAPTCRITVAGRLGGAGRWPYRALRWQTKAVSRLDHERGLLRQLTDDATCTRADVARHLACRAAANARDVAAALRPGGSQAR